MEKEESVSGYIQEMADSIGEGENSAEDNQKYLVLVTQTVKILAEKITRLVENQQLIQETLLTYNDSYQEMAKQILNLEKDLRASIGQGSS